jgi:hypothetical protein
MLPNMHRSNLWFGSKSNVRYLHILVKLLLTDVMGRDLGLLMSMMLIHSGRNFGRLMLRRSFGMLMLRSSSRRSFNNLMLKSSWSFMLRSSSRSFENLVVMSSSRSFKNFMLMSNGSFRNFMLMGSRSFRSLMLGSSSRSFQSLMLNRSFYLTSMNLRRCNIFELRDVMQLIRMWGFSRSCWWWWRRRGFFMGSLFVHYLHMWWSTSHFVQVKVTSVNLQLFRGRQGLNLTSAMMQLGEELSSLVTTP